MPDQIGLDKEFTRGDPNMQTSGSVGTRDIGNPEAADYFQGSYKGVLNLSQLKPGRWVTIDIAQDEPKKYEVMKVGSDLVLVQDEETHEEFLIPIYKVSLVDLQTPYDDHELEKYSTNPSVRRLAQDKTVEKRKRHEGDEEGDKEKDKNRDKEKDKDSDSGLKSKDNKSGVKVKAAQGQKNPKGKMSLSDRFKARMYPPMPGNRVPENAKVTDQSGVGIKPPRLSHMFGKFRGFLDNNKRS